MTFDYTIITDPLDLMTLSYGGLFVTLAQRELVGIAVIVFVMSIVVRGWRGGLVDFFVKYSLLLIIATNLLRYWYTPGFLHSPYSVSNILPEWARYLADIIDKTRLQHFTTLNNATLANIQAATSTWKDWTLLPMIWAFQFFLWIMQAFAFASILVSYGAIGVLRLLGPLFIPWMIVPAMSWLPWNLFQSLLQYSFYRVVAQAIIYVMDAALTAFVVKSLHGDYTVANLAYLAPQLLAMVFGLCWLLIRAGSMAADVFKGGASAGTNFFSSATRSVIQTVAVAKMAMK